MFDWDLFAFSAASVGVVEWFTFGATVEFTVGVGAMVTVVDEVDTGDTVWDGCVVRDEGAGTVACRRAEREWRIQKSVIARTMTTPTRTPIQGNDDGGCGG